MQRLHCSVKLSFLLQRRHRRDFELGHWADDFLRRVELEVEERLRYAHLEQVVGLVAYREAFVAELLREERKV